MSSISVIEDRRDPEGDAIDAPPSPLTVADTGLTEGHISDLAMKILFRRGALTGEELALAMALAYPVIDDLLLTLQQRHFLEVLATRGHGRSGYTFGLTDQGTASRAQGHGLEPVRGPCSRDPRDLSGVGPASIRQERQGTKGGAAGRVLRSGVPGRRVRRAGPGHQLRELHLPARSSGNGKTAIAERLGSLTSEAVYLPRALMVAAHVIVMEDPIYHRSAPSGNARTGEALLREGHRMGPAFHAREATVRLRGR